MADWEKVKLQIEGLINSAGETTGKNITNLTDGINELISGYGKGASDDLRYVTFMSHDGTIEYGKKAVAVGDDCADPIARGIFGKPTRESDAQYNYTHNGWATEPNGSAVSAWNKAITEDRTVYASFASDLRYYTITYYDSDGTTVLKTESLAYGSMPSYKPEKEGYGFGGWSPELATVTKDASYTVVWAEKITFANGSWDDIIAISESGKARENFAIGDKKTITIGDTSVELMIIGFDHDDKFDGTGKAGMTILTMSPLPNTTINNTVIGTVRSFCQNTLVAQLPETLRNAVKPVTKKTNYFGSIRELEWYGFPLSMTDAKIRKYQSRQYGDADWDDLFEDGGTPYEYFETNYNSTLMGPAYKWLSGINNTWMRNQVKINSTMYNVAGKYPPVTTTSSMYAHTTHVTYDTTTEKSVLFGFCI